MAPPQQPGFRRRQRAPARRGPIADGLGQGGGPAERIGGAALGTCSRQASLPSAKVYACRMRNATSEAAARFYEAAGLFRNAELTPMYSAAPAIRRLNRQGPEAPKPEPSPTPVPPAQTAPPAAAPTPCDDAPPGGRPAA